jgi:hypothetical protein
MKTININPARVLLFSLLSLILFFTTCTPALAQHNIVANKDNTRPEMDKVFSSPAFINSFSVEKWYGYNEIKWTAFREQETRKYVIEYSTNGIDFQSAGELIVTPAASYTLKHYTNINKPLLYRVKMEELNGKVSYSASVVIEGTNQTLVTFYPTMVNSNVININADLPIERMVIVSSSGQQVFAKELNGQSQHIPVVIPSLGKGIYFVNFYGRDWKTAGKFIIP